jgi:hypothetical protein
MRSDVESETNISAERNAAETDEDQIPSPGATRGRHVYTAEETAMNSIESFAFYLALSGLGLMATAWMWA